MMNVNELIRNAKNIVKKYSDAQVKVREATSNDPWGPSSTIMAEIADMTYNVFAFPEIMQMIWKRLNDHGKNWRHVFKSLVLLEYLIKTGTDKVAQQCIENIFAIQTLKDFQYIEDSKDHGQSIREKSKKVVALLKDPERLKADRARALKAKSRIIEAVSSSGKSSYSYMTSRNGNGSGDTAINSGSGSMNNSSSSNNNNNVSFPSFADGDGGSAIASDIDSARPQTLTEEETQLQIALALSKEEAERQEKTRKNDELRLKLALDVSKKASGSMASGSNDFLSDLPCSSSSMASGQQQSHQQSTSKSGKQSNIDDLLGLSFTPSSTTTSHHHQQQQQLSSLSQAPFSISSIPTRHEPLNDPWSVDPWQPSASSSALPMQPQPLMNSQVILPQPAIVHQTTTTTLLPSTQLVNTTIVPNQFSVSEVDSIFGGSGIGGTVNPKKTMSKNPFED